MPGEPYSGIPDVILKNNTNELKVIGKLKVPWVAQHEMGYLCDEADLRTLLAEPINYMQDLNCIYGFLSMMSEGSRCKERTK
jgi:hypothetical protein